jgi:hypothetical protein
MSFTTRDVRCTAKPDEHYECSSVYRVSDGPSACHCGAPRVAFWATREMEGKAHQDKLDASLAGFGSVRYEGQNISRADLDAKLTEYAAHQGVPKESLTFESVGSKGERADFHRHRAWENRRKNGFDTQQFREYQREQRREH